MGGSRLSDGMSVGMSRVASAQGTSRDRLFTLMATRVEKLCSRRLTNEEKAIVRQHITNIAIQRTVVDKDLRQIASMFGGVLSRGGGTDSAIGEHNTEVASGLSRTQQERMLGTRSPNRRVEINEGINTKSAVGIGRGPTMMSNPNLSVLSPSLKGAKRVGSSLVSASSSFVGSTTASAVDRKKKQKEDAWALMAFQEVEEFKQEQQQYFTMQKESRYRQRAALDTQIRERDAIRQIREREEAQYTAEELEQLKRFAEEEKDAAKKRKEKNRAQQMVRDVQLKEHEERKRLEEYKKKVEDEEMSAQLKADLENEKRQEAARRLRAREDVNKFLQFNEQQKEAKRREMMAEAEADKRHQQMAKERNEQIERDRSAALKKMYERQTHQAEMANQIQLMKEQRAVEDAERLRKEQDRIDEIFANQEYKRKTHQDEEKERLKQHLGNQMAQRHEAKRREMEEVQRLREQLNNAAEDAASAEREQRRLRRDVNVAHKRALEEQIKEKRIVALGEGMSSTEKSLNASRLQKLDVSTHA